MKRFRATLTAVLLAAGVFSYAAYAKQASELLQDGLYAEETEGNLDAAMKIYTQIIADSSAERPAIAQAMYRLGMCYMKKQDQAKAREIFGNLVKQYGDQQAVIAKVQPMLDEMTGIDPATLMPADTKFYVEIGEPGRQVETILKMLQGTPLANPLAAIGGGRGNGEKSPGDIVGAILNPSMMAEFKKIRGFAAGATNVGMGKGANPPVVVVLYPGESDALRGIILMALNVAGTPGEAIEGLNTVQIKNGPGAAYDDQIVILAQPAELLKETVRKYKGLSKEPSLATSNKTFSKLGAKARKKNLSTVWIDAASAFQAVKKQMGAEGALPPQIQLVNGIVDFNNIEDIIGYEVLEETGITSETIVNFKPGHNCLPYNLIRTPNLSKSSFDSVPAGAVALLSISLTEGNSEQVDATQKAVKRLTGLDIGREIFANIEQINIFAMPQNGQSGGSLSLTDGLSCLGVSITSRNPEQTRLLLGQVLTIANLAARTATQQQSPDQPDTYLVGAIEGKPIYCCLGQTKNVTILAFSPKTVAASLAAIDQKKSALAEGPLAEPLKALPPGTSKLAMVNVGGAIRIADFFITAINNNPQNPGHKTMEALAAACDKTTIRLYTIETDNTLTIHSSLNNIPALDSVFPLIAQLGQYDITAKAEATGPMPADGATLRVDAEVKLGWKSGAGAASHKIYFGSVPDKLTLLAEVNKPDELKTPQPKAGGKSYWRVDEVLADGSIIEGKVWSFDLSGKLLGWWKMDESTGNSVADASGNKNAGATRGNVAWRPSAGKIAGAAEFDGGDSYIEIANESAFDVTSQISIAAWIKVNKFDKRFQTIISKGDADGWVLHRDAESDHLGFAFGQDRWVVGETAVNDGQWHHVAVTYDGGKLVMFIDGRQDADNHVSGPIPVNNTPVCIGENPTAKGRSWNGLIDEVRIYNYTLSTDEVASLYEVAATAPQPADGGAIGSAVEIKPAWKPAAGAKTHRLFFGDSTDNLSLLAEVDSPGKTALPKLKQDTTYYWRVDEVMDGAAVITGRVWSFTTSGKLLGWWKFDESEGKTASDSSGGGHDGTVQGKTAWQPAGGKIGGAIDLQAAGYVDIPDEAAFDASKQITVACWVNIRNVPYAWAGIVTKGDASWRLSTVDRGRKAHFSITDWQKTFMNGKKDIPAGQWRHITAVYDGSQMRIYVDGLLDSALAWTGGILNNDQPVFIGENAELRGRYFDGLIDDVRIYDYALSDGEIAALAQGQ